MNFILGCPYSDPIKVNFNLSPMHLKRNLAETFCSVCLDFNKGKVVFLIINYYFNTFLNN